MRCPDCNRFVSYDDGNDPEPELDFDNGEVTGTVRILLTCAECGTELKEGTFEVSVPMEDELQAHLREKHPEMVSKGTLPDGSEVESFDYGYFEVSDNGSELTTRTTGSGRGMRTFYGHDTAFTVECTNCHEEWSDAVSEDMQASDMDELT